MQAKFTTHDLKLFSCQFHPSENIERVCTDPDTDRSLQCIECVLQNKSQLQKDKFCSLLEFIDDAVQQYTKIEHTLSFLEAPSSDLVDFLNYEEAKMKAFAYHIEKEKQKVNESFNLILQQLTSLCYSKKEEILAKLDMQVLFLKNNYANYKSKIDKYFKKKGQQDQQEGFDKDSLIQKINGCKDTLEMETLVRNIKDDISQFNSTEDQGSKIAEIKADLRAFADELKNQSNLAPKALCNDSASLEKFHNEASALMDRLSDFQDSIHNISGSNLFINSKLITTTHGMILLKKWLAPAIRYPHLRLLYRGSRDGLTAEIFHQRCDGITRTLTVAKSTSGNIFGGYSDQPWGSVDAYKQSSGCWLFSLDNKEKYPVKNVSSAIYNHQNYGPTFGNGYDLHFNLTNKSGSSNLGQAYICNTGNGPTRFAGSNNFMLAEIEIFEVLGQTPNDPNPHTDSKIFDSFQDLNLVHKWATDALKTSKTSKVKKVGFKLIYRGSRDGFDAQAFHSYCDNQGPTVVVCKSESSEFIFGGFTSQNWSRRNTYFQDKSAFLFSVTHKTKHPVIDSDHAIFCNGRTGPIFGKGNDLLIAGDANKNEESFSKLGASYKINSDKMDDLSAYMAGTAQFKLLEIEVFRVTKKV